jgi:AraC family ethanolamine operon transcriptional activator
MPHAVAEQVCWRELDEIAPRLAGVSCVGVSLRPGRDGGMLSSVRLADTSVQVLRGAPMLMLVSSLPRRTTLVKALDGTRRARWNGTPLGADRIAVCDSSRLHDAAYPDDFACLLLSFGEAANDRIAPATAAPEAGAQVAAQARDGGAALRELDRISRAVETLAGRPELLAHPGAAQGLRSSILDAADAVLAQSRPVAARPARTGSARQQLVHAADAYLRANPARPVYTEELCAAIGASATRLHQAFHATFGISPHRYLKLRRMGMVRAMLLSSSGPWHSVKAAALSHGFWHLGQFAHDYRDLYGELPSETLARARPTTAGPGGFDLRQAPASGASRAGRSVMRR